VFDAMPDALKVMYSQYAQPGYYSFAIKAQLYKDNVPCTFEGASTQWEYSLDVQNGTEPLYIYFNPDSGIYNASIVQGTTGYIDKPFSAVADGDEFVDPVFDYQLVDYDRKQILSDQLYVDSDGYLC
jgi:hypothetical protein